MLVLNLQPIFTARGIEKPYTFLVKNGFTYHSAHYLLNSKTRAIKLDHIEQLCQILLCEPNDLLLWIPDKDTITQPNNPLQKLRNNPGTQRDLKKALSGVPYSQLKEISDKLNNEINGQE